MSTVPRAGVRLRFCTDSGEFLAAAGDHLSADPVVNTVVTTIAYRMLSQRAEGISRPGRTWWLVVSDDSGAVVGAGMRTAPHAPHPPFLLPMPGEAAVALAHALHERGEEVLAVNGALPAAELCAAELTRLGGGRVHVAQHTRLHELGELTWPPPVPGRLVAATEDDLDLVTQWCAAFVGDADEQSGRQRGARTHEALDRAELLRRLRAGRLWFWVDDAGEPVHLTGANPPSFGVARVGPVYTPPSQRGRGWASNAVAEVSRRIQAEGARACLFTDQANPTSNKIYAALGYRPVVDMANLVIVPEALSPRNHVDSGQGDDTAPIALDWARASNLNDCQKPEDVDAAFDRGEQHVGAALIALVYNNPDTDAVLPRVARGLRWPNPETRRQSLLALMHTARLHGRVDDLTLELLHGLLLDRTPISPGSRYEVWGTANQTVGDLKSFLPSEQLPDWVNAFTDH